MEWLVVDEREMGAAMERAIRAGLCRCFPEDAETFGRTRAWHGSGPAYTVVARDAGAIVGHVGAVVREIGVGGAGVRIAGVQNVFVVPERRGRGIVERLLARAMEEGRRRGLEVGVLFCAERLVKLYARCGWLVVPGRVVWAERADGERYRLAEKNVLMEFGLVQGGLPAGEVDLRGEDW